MSSIPANKARLDEKYYCKLNQAKMSSIAANKARLKWAVFLQTKSSLNEQYYCKYTLVKNIVQEKRQNEKYSCKQAQLDVYKAKLK